MNSPAIKIAQRFGEAAHHYDRQAQVQAHAAEHLVAMAQPHNMPQSILDIGSGTGFVAQAAFQRWPVAAITALDRAPEMLREAQRKLPHLHIVTGDAAQTDPTPSYDIIFSSMMLHWLSDPLAALQRWQKSLKPQGKLYIALLVEGSFKEWRDLCRAHKTDDGLWNMPSRDFADRLAVRSEFESMTIPYASAHAFLKRLKDTGAATARTEYRPMNTSCMRHLLRVAPQPFGVTYEILYLELTA